MSENLVTISAWAFDGCSGITGKLTFTNKVAAIGRNAFSGTGITSVYIPKSITSSAISSSTSYTSEGPFYNTGLTTIEYEEGITSIAPGLFRGCTRLTDITIPATVTTIGSNAFLGCSSLTTVTYNGSNWNGITINSGNDPLVNAYNN